MGNTLSTTVGAFRNINGVGQHGNGTGSDLTFGMPSGSSLDFSPLDYDFNRDNVKNNEDIEALANAVVPIVQRALEPFDIVVTVAVRPERLELYGLGETVPARLNAVRGRVTRRVYFGDVFYYDVDTPDGMIEVKEENRPGVELHEIGEEAVVAWDPSATTVVES